MKFYYLPFILLLLFSNLSIGQSAIEFNMNSYDFGTIPEEAGKVSIDFNFTNLTKDSIKVIKVTPSCGCIASVGAKHYIQPNEEGQVTLTYNPLNRPGTFTKEASVHFSNGNVVDLHLAGFVTSADIPLAKVLPHQSGVLRFKTARVNLGNLPTKSIQSFTILVANESEQTIVVDKEKSYIPAHIEMDLGNYEFQAKQFTLIRGIYNAPSNAGYNDHAIQLYTSDSLEIIKKFEVVANIYPSADQNTPSLARISLDKSVEDFGKVNEGEKLTATFEVTNQGSSELIISSIVPNCACISVASKELVIKPATSKTIEITYDTSLITGKQVKVIHLYSNAENGYLHQLVLRAEIK